MALEISYLTSAKNVGSILEAMRRAQAPERFTTRFLASLGFSSAQDRLIIPVLKDMGFLKESGEPTQRYFDFLDASVSNRVLAQGIREAFAELFKVNKEAHKLSKHEVRNKLRTLTEGKLGESALDKLSLTFTTLCALADWSDLPTTVEVREEPAGPVVATAETNKIVDIPPRLTQGLHLHYTIQLHLPETRDPAVYDVLFKSLKEHVLR